MHAVTEADGEVHCGDEGDALLPSTTPCCAQGNAHLVCCWRKKIRLAEKFRRRRKGEGEESLPCTFVGISMCFAPLFRYIDRDDIKMVPGRVACC